MNRTLSLSLITIAFSAVTGSALADDDFATSLEQCRAISADAKRLECYDGIGVETVAVAAPVEAVATPPDELGAENLKSRKDDEEPQAVEATVIRCTKDSFKKYYFYLEGGQVWKQVSDKKLRYKECNFKVSIVKDFFGYKMQQEGEKSRIRVSRVR